MISRTVRAVLPALVLLAGIGGELSGQAVGGVVVDETTGAPLNGAMVVLIGSKGEAVDRVLTDGAGLYTLSAEAVGPHSIRVDRIGFQSLTTETFEVPEEGLYRRVEVPIRPIRLAGLDVDVSPRCELGTEVGLSTGRVWEEARKALEAAAWTLEAGVYRYTLLNYQRQLDEYAGRVLDEQRELVRRTAQAPYRGLPPGELAARGYITQEDDGAWWFWAPDANALTSTAFLDSHCIRLAAEDDGELGLEFEPAPDRRLPDIRGTIWVDAETAALRRIEFSYVNRPPLFRRGAAQGKVVFGPMPNGTWVVRQWDLQVPQIYSPTTGRLRGSLRDLPVTGYRVQGGTLWEAVTSAGATVFQAEAGTVMGSVVDSLGAPPRGGATVRVEEHPEGPMETRVAPSGSFVVSGLAAGRWELTVHTPERDSLQLQPVAASVMSEEGTVSPVTVRIPGVEETLRAACNDQVVAADEDAVVFGRVLRGGVPMDGARVHARWRRALEFTVPPRAAPARDGFSPLEWSLDPEDPSSLLATLDERGVFLICGLPRGAEFRVDVETGDRRPPRTEYIRIDRAGEVQVVRLRVPE